MGKTHDNDEEFIKLFKEREKKIFFTILGILRKQDGAEDVFQETAIKGLKNFHALKDKSSFNAWIIKIAINNSYDFLKKQKRLYDVSELNIPYYDDYSEDDSILFSSLDSLSKDERIVVILKVFKDISYNEISKITNRPINTLKSVYSRSLKKMIKHLEAKGYTLE